MLYVRVNHDVSCIKNAIRETSAKYWLSIRLWGALREVFDYEAGFTLVNNRGNSCTCKQIDTNCGKRLEMGF